MNLAHLTHRWRSMGLALTLSAGLLACGGDEEQASAPDPSSIEIADEAAAPEPATEPAAEVPAEPAVDLLHALATTLRVSSAYEGQREQVAKLVDGNLESAWNSQSGDLVGAWIEVEIPEGATVTELQLTAGFARVQRGTDLFTANHRVAEVQVSRDGGSLGTHALNIESRELQPIPLTGGAGRYRLTITRVAPGTRPEWREICISELRVMGHAASAEVGAHTPTVEVDTSYAPADPNAAYLSVLGRGLVRLDASGATLLFEGRIADFAVDSAGAAYVISAEEAHRNDGRRLFVIRNGERSELTVPPHNHFHTVALEPSGAPVLANSDNIWRRQGEGWAAEIMDDDPHAGEQPQDLAIDSDGVTWARGQHRIFRGVNGQYQAEFIGERNDANPLALAVGPSAIAVTTQASICMRRGSWFCVPYRGVLHAVAVGPDRTAVAASFGKLTVVPARGIHVIEVPLEGVGSVTGLARDAQDRTWVAGSGGLFVLGPDHAILGRWPADALPDIGGLIFDLEVHGEGPPLPRAGSAEPATEPGTETATEATEPAPEPATETALP